MNTNIEIDDTVRFIGRKARWVVQGIKGNDVEVIGMWRLNRNTQRIIIRTVDMDRIELVRKGNAEKDSLAKLDREMAAARGITVQSYRAEIQASYERNKAAAAAREAAEREAAELARIAAVERAAREAAEAAEAAELAAIESARKAAEDARWTEAYEARVAANNGDMIAALLDMIPTE